MVFDKPRELDEVPLVELIVHGLKFAIRNAAGHAIRLA